MWSFLKNIELVLNLQKRVEALSLTMRHIQRHTCADSTYDRKKRAFRYGKMQTLKVLLESTCNDATLSSWFFGDLTTEDS